MFFGRIILRASSQAPIGNSTTIKYEMPKADTGVLFLSGGNLATADRAPSCHSSIDQIATAFADAKPWMKFLCDALQQPF